MNSDEHHTAENQPTSPVAVASGNDVRPQAARETIPQNSDQPSADMSKSEALQIRVGRATGPRTVRGRAMSSKNALKFGFFSKEVAIETSFYKEWKPRYERIIKALRQDWNPIGATEVLLVELLAVQFIQYLRLLRIQQAFILKENTPPVPSLDYLYRLEDERLRAQEIRGTETHSDEDEEIRRGRIVDERARQKYKKEFERQDQLEREHARIDELRRALPEPDDLAWLQRCENHILRHLYRVLSELERLQRMRLGDQVPPRYIVEVRDDSAEK